jgi:hypothetical protein
LKERDAEGEMGDGGEVLQQSKGFLEGNLNELYGDAAFRVPPPVLLTIDQLRPGDAHSLYSTKDDAGRLYHPDYSFVIRHASQVAGCRAAEMADTVYAVEVRVIKMLLWKKREREAFEKQKTREEQGKRRPGRPRKEHES